MSTQHIVALFSSLALGAGCATVGGLPERGAAGSGRGQLTLDTRSPDDARATFPTRLSRAELPGADRLANKIAVEAGGAVATEVKLCVAPDGSVEKVDLLGKSALPDYDAAVVDGLADWKYAAYKAPASVRVCEKLTVSYRAR